MPYALSIIFVEIPYTTIATTCTFVGFYWASGLEMEALSGFYYWILMIVFNVYAVTLGQSVAALSEHRLVAWYFIVPNIITFFYLFCGVLITPSQMPGFWRSWVYPAMPSRYYLEGSITSFLRDSTLRCSPEDFNIFSPPPNVTCGEYLSSFFAKNNTGYLNDSNAKETCQYCQYANGPEYYENYLDWSADNMWRNFGILLIYLAFSVVTLVIFTWYLRKPTR